MGNAGKEVSYVVGNATEKSFSAFDRIDQVSRGVATVESGKAIGSTAFKAAIDYTEGDKVCTGLCLVATACEFVVGGSSIIKYPGALKVYFIAKSISAGCIKYRDACKDARGKIIPCP